MPALFLQSRKKEAFRQRASDCFQNQQTKATGGLLGRNQSKLQRPPVSGHIAKWTHQRDAECKVRWKATVAYMPRFPVS